MQVILLERVEKLGQMGQVVTVKPGYARNFLLPKKKAMRATKGNLAYFDQQKAQLEAANLKRKEDASYVSQKMENVCVTLIRQASETGLLYGSVRSSDISKCLVEEGFTVTRSQVELTTPIKTIGRHQAKVTLHPEVFVMVNVVVAQSEEEALAHMPKAGKETVEESN
jgi:large subunit ribosomal protein L9